MMHEVTGGRIDNLDFDHQQARDGQIAIKIIDLLKETNDDAEIQKAVTDIAKQSLERDCRREFDQPYDVVLRRANRALRALGREEQPDETDAQMTVFIAERLKFFEVISDKLGVTIEV